MNILKPGYFDSLQTQKGSNNIYSSGFMLGLNKDYEKATVFVVQKNKRNEKYLKCAGGCAPRSVVGNQHQKGEDYYNIFSQDDASRYFIEKLQKLFSANNIKVSNEKFFKEIFSYIPRKKEELVNALEHLEEISVIPVEMEFVLSNVKPLDKENPFDESQHIKSFYKITKAIYFVKENNVLNVKVWNEGDILPHEVPGFVSSIQDDDVLGVEVVKINDLRLDLYMDRSKLNYFQKRGIEKILE